jgi:ABC-type multidrug transport system ATPase subunit
MQQPFEAFQQNEQCPKAVEMGDPVCLNGGQLYFHTGAKALHPESCAHCTCPDGWGGLDCGLCDSLASCPKDAESGSDAIMCTEDTLWPTEEEASGDGKVLSCTCGGGEDDWSEFLCKQQTDTRVQIVIRGGGVAGDPLTATFKEYAAVRRALDEEWPGQLDYFYPAVFNGALSACEISMGKCLDVPGTTVGQRDCVVISCDETVIACPPENYPICEGFPDCQDSQGRKRSTHKCDAIPTSGKGLVVTCEKVPKPDRSFICYFQQPQGFAALSLTCKTGGCIYDSPSPIPGSGGGGGGVIQSGWNIGMQALFLLGIVAVLLVSFAACAWRGGRKVSRKRTYESLNSGPEGEDEGYCEDGWSTELALDALPPPLHSGLDGHASISWEDLRYSLEGRGGIEREVLRGVSGHCGGVDARRVTAILGPSGSGKSSLLSILAGRLTRLGPLSPRLSGKVLLNGRACSPAHLREICGFVAQEDVLPGTQTVLEHLLFHAILRLSAGSWSESARERKVWDVLARMGLWDVAHSRIGDNLLRGLSGGERRRVSIAVELLSNSQIIFMDEPTTGLDAANALRVLEVLRSLAESGVNCVATLHQPRKDIFESIGHAIVLLGGSVVYSGTPEESAAYFSSIGRPLPPTGNLADALLDMCLSAEGEDLPALYLSVNAKTSRSDAYGLDEAEPQEDMPALGGQADVHLGKWKKVPMPPICVQLVALAKRSLQRAFRHPLLLTLHFVGAILMGLLLGSIFLGHLGRDLSGAQSRFGLLFFILIYLQLLGLTSLPIWREERLLFRSETSAGLYFPSSYLAATGCVDLLLVRVIPPLLFTLIVYPLAGLNISSDGQWCLLVFSLVLVLTNACGSLMAMAVGAAGLPLSLSNLLGGLLVLMSALLGRFLVNEHRIPAVWRWVGELTPVGHAFEALLINEFSDPLSERPYRIEGSHCSPDLPVVEPLGPEILHTFDFDDSYSTMWGDIGALIGLVVAYFVIASLVLVITTHHAVVGDRDWDVAKLRVERSRWRPRWFGGSNRRPSVRAAQPALPLATTRVPYRPLSHRRVGGSLISWESVSYSLTVGGKKRAILKSVTGFAGGADCSQVTALMGPSGAGKSSLLRRLAGRASPGATNAQMSGIVRLNGKIINQEEMCSAIGFVSQEDILPGKQTVLEHLKFNAGLRLPVDWSQGQKQGRAVEILDQLGLELVADSMIGDEHCRGISGGECRRLSIGVELLSSPQILLCDEPTSRLDAANALRVMKVLGEVAASGTAVLVSLHQPREEIFQELGRVMLLSSGQVVFFGPPAAATSHFASIGQPLDPAVSIADAMLDATAAASERGIRVSSADLSSHDATALTLLALNAAATPDPSPAHFTGAKLPPFHLQFCHLFVRVLRNYVRDPALVFLHILVTALIAVGSGSAFWHINSRNEETSGTQDRLGLLFFFLMYTAVLGLSAAPLWTREMRLFRHESASQMYGTLSFFLASSLPDLVLCKALPCLLLVGIAFPMAGMRCGGWHFVAAWSTLTLFTASMGATYASLGLLTCRPAAATAASCLSLLIFALFGGFLISRLEMPAEWIWVVYVSPFHWAMEGLLVNELHGLGAIFRLTTRIGTHVARTGYLDGDAILHCFDYIPSLLAGDLFALLFLSFVGWLFVWWLLLREQAALRRLPPMRASS